MANPILEAAADVVAGLSQSLRAPLDPAMYDVIAEAIADVLRACRTPSPSPSAVGADLSAGLGCTPTDAIPGAGTSASAAAVVEEGGAR